MTDARTLPRLRDRPTRSNTGILVIGPDEALHTVARQYLGEFRLSAATNAWRGLEVLRSRQVDLVLLDLALPDATGLLVIDEIRAERHDVEVVALGPGDDIELAVSAVKRGAFDFLPKAYGSFDRLPTLVRRALEHRQRRLDQVEAQTRDAWLSDAFDLLERSDNRAVQSMVTAARRVATSAPVVLLRGEEGSGKELFARYIHALSDRASERFVAVSIPAVPPSLLEVELFGHVKGAFAGGESRVGKFEIAAGGTLFLGEVGGLSPGAQERLADVLRRRAFVRVGGREARNVETVLLASSSHDLAAAVADGRFRGDLYDLLATDVVDVVPLRDRLEDLPDLVALLARKHAAAMRREPPRLDAAVVDVLSSNDWPGNIRELDGLVMRLVATHGGALVAAEDIPPEFWLAHLHRQAAAAAERADGRRNDSRLYFLAREQFERYLVRLMVKRCGGNKRAAARVLGVSYSTVKDKSR